MNEHDPLLIIINQITNFDIFDLQTQKIVLRFFLTKLNSHYRQYTIKLIKEGAWKKYKLEPHDLISYLLGLPSFYPKIITYYLYSEFGTKIIIPSSKNKNKLLTILEDHDHDELEYCNNYIYNGILIALFDRLPTDLLMVLFPPAERNLINTVTKVVSLIRGFNYINNQNMIESLDYYLAYVVLKPLLLVSLILSYYHVVTHKYLYYSSYLDSEHLILRPEFKPFSHTKLVLLRGQ